MNTFATSNGWERNRCIFRARATVSLSSSLKAVVAGEYDHLPEGAFYMVGGIDEVIAKAEKMAAEAA